MDLHIAILLVVKLNQLLVLRTATAVHITPRYRAMRATTSPATATAPRFQTATAINYKATVAPGHTAKIPTALRCMEAVVLYQAHTQTLAQP
jgi:hypothetical protein